MNSAADRILSRLGLFGLELHKTMWIQRGLLVLAALAAAISGLGYGAEVPVTSQAEQAARQYTLNLAGEITDGALRRIDSEQSALDNTIEQYNLALTGFENGLIDYPELDRLSREASAATARSDGLSRVRSRCLELLVQGEAEGFRPWLLDETPFDSLYGPPAQSDQLSAALLAVLALTLILSGSLSFERQSGVTYLIRSTPRGRRPLMARKLLLAAAVSGAVWAAVYLPELWVLVTRFHVTCWAAPVRCVSALARSPMNCPIYMALAALYLARFVMILSCGALVTAVSVLFRWTETAALAACALTLVPSLLYIYAGVDAFRLFAPVLPLAAMPLILPASGALTGCGAAAVLPLAGAASCAWLLAGDVIFSRKNVEKFPSPCHNRR